MPCGTPKNETEPSWGFQRLRVVTSDKRQLQAAGRIVKCWDLAYGLSFNTLNLADCPPVRAPVDVRGCLSADAVVYVWILCSAQCSNWAGDTRRSHEWTRTY